MNSKAGAQSSPRKTVNNIGGTLQKQLCRIEPHNPAYEKRSITGVDPTKTNLPD
jgi:predicted CoA-binding protein